MTRWNYRIETVLETFVLRYMLGLMVITLALSTPVRADTLKVMAAGSLRAAVMDLLHRFPLESDTVDPPRVWILRFAASKDRKRRSR